MVVIARLAMLAVAALVTATPGAAAETCGEPTLSQALSAVQIAALGGAGASGQIALMDGYVASCPEHAWINVLGGELDIMAFRAVRSANGGVVNQEAVSYLSRALLRSNVFFEAPEETRRDRYGVLGMVSQANLTHSVASTSRKAIIVAFVELARAGTVHPYFKAEEPLVCEGWLTSDSQTVAYQVTDARDVVFLPFLDAAADACRGAQGQLGRMPLAMKAVANMRLVERELVKDPAEIERLLRAARRAADDFKGTDNFRTLAFGDSDDLKLTALIRKHGVHTGEGPALIDRSLWFTQAYIGSETAIRSIVYSLPEYWTPLAAGETGASSEEVAKARSQFTSYVLQLKRQGTEAGLEAETEAMLREAVTAFHKGEIIPPEAATTKPMMPWLYDMIIRLLTPAPAAE